jgi:hypothetical protein
MRVAERIDLRMSHKNFPSQQYGQDRAECFPPARHRLLCLFRLPALRQRPAQPVGGRILLLATRARRRATSVRPIRVVDVTILLAFTHQACQAKQA